MLKKSITIFFVLLMVLPLFATTNSTTLESTKGTLIDSTAALAETDLGRVTIQSNIFPNNG
jgi:hypothetical protein